MRVEEEEEGEEKKKREGDDGNETSVEMEHYCSPSEASLSSLITLINNIAGLESKSVTCTASASASTTTTAAASGSADQEQEDEEEGDGVLLLLPSAAAAAASKFGPMEVSLRHFPPSDQSPPSDSGCGSSKCCNVATKQTKPVFCIRKRKRHTKNHNNHDNVLLHFPSI